jgi:MoaA/NifB/PqqE/SkfB family radical SAM enzyme
MDQNAPIFLRERPNKSDQLPQLGVAYFGLFDNCNVQCNMCDCWTLPKSRPKYDQYLQVLVALKELQPQSIRFTGGEPLLFRRLPELIAVASAGGTRVSVITNGRLIVRRLQDLVLSGCDEVVMSLDAVGSTHDSVRGVPGLFDECIKGIESLAALRCHYGVNTVVQQQTVDGIESLASLLVGLPQPPQWWHLIPVRGKLPIRGEGQLQPTSPQLASYQNVLNRIQDSVGNAGITLIADNFPTMDDQQFHCAVPNFSAYVRADTGNVYSCNMLTYVDPPIGNLLRQRPHEVWHGAQAELHRRECGAGIHRGCARCDLASQEMNHHLRQLGKNVELRQQGRAQNE